MAANDASSSSSPGTVISGNPFSIRRFDGKNFTVWKAQIEAYLVIKDCLEPLTNEKPAKDSALWQDKDNVARAILLLSLSDDQAVLVCHFKTAKEIWDRLCESYMQKSQSNKLVLQRQFFDAQMNENEKCIDYISRVQQIFNQLKDSGVIMGEDTLVGRIVAGLTPVYHSFMTTWSNNSERQTMSVLLPKLLAEESLIKKLKIKPDQETANIALFSQSTYRKTNGFQRNKSYHQKDPRKTTNDWKRQAKCHNCGKQGHIKPDCRFLKKQTVSQQRSTKDNQPEATVVEGLVAEANLVLDDASWIMDSGASDHMCSDVSVMSNYHKLESDRYVKFGDHRQAKVVGIGEVYLKSCLPNGYKSIRLENVLHVPTLRRKLISLGMATSSGNTATIGPNDIRIYNVRGELIIQGEKQGNLFRADVEEIKPKQSELFIEETEAEEEEQTETEVDADVNADGKKDDEMVLWHERFAHASRRTIANMKKFNSVIGLEDCNFKMDPKSSDRKIINCQSCCLAKLTRKTFPSSERPRADAIGKRVHVDICGPIATSLNGRKYLVLFKDEYSNFRIPYFVKSTEEVFDCLQNMIIKIKSDTGQSVTTLVSDNGPEFTSNRAQKLLKESGIAHQTSAPFTPAQNGFIERDNRTIMEAVRAIMIHRSLPQNLWAEVCNATVYTWNHIVNSNSQDKTPFELYYGRKPRVSHLRVIGSLAFMKAQEKKRSGYQKKLEPRAILTILIGYERDFTYRLYNPETKKVVITRDVIFDERKTYEKWNQSHQTTEYPDIDKFLATPEGVNEFSEVSFVDFNDEPRNYEEAISCPDSEKWIAAMDNEYQALIENDTWQVVQSLPSDRKAIGSRWVFKIKRHPDGSLDRYKARVVAKGFSQKSGIDFQEVFSPVVRFESIRLLLSLVASLDLDFMQLDVKTAFLNGELEEELYIKLPEGYNEQQKFCRLNKSIYGLKQASRCWNKTFMKFLKNFNLRPLETDSCVLVKNDSEGLLIIAIYVDDGLVCGSNRQILDNVINHLKSKFQITLSEPKCFVGLELNRKRDEKKLTISQPGYIMRLMEKFELCNANSAEIPIACQKFCKEGIVGGPPSKTVSVPYREAVGALMYIMTSCRPDIALAVMIVASYCENPKLPHWDAVKQIMRYLKATAELGITFDGTHKTTLLAYSDADWASCVDTRRSRSGVILIFANAPIIWKAPKQATVAESTTEAEFIACSITSREVIWCRNFMAGLGQPLVRPTRLLTDNHSAISLIKNNQIHSRIKHIDIRLMAIRERNEKGEVAVEYIPTGEQVADLLTKPLPPTRFKLLRNVIMLTMIAMMTIPNSSAFKLSIVNPSTPRAPLRVELNLINPCRTARKTEETMRGPAALDPVTVINQRAIDISNSLCEKIYSERVLPALADIAGCLPVRREKRDISAALGTAYSLISTIIGVTNLVKGISEELRPSEHLNITSDLIPIVEQQTDNLLQNKQVRVDEVERELMVVSESSLSHREAIHQEAGEIPPVLWAAMHVLHESYAGAANLRAIKNQCENGRLATKEIGEMLEHRHLMEMDPDETILESVTVNVAKSSLEFTYSVRTKIIIDFNQIFTIMTISVFMIMMMTMNYIILSHIRDSRQPPTVIRNRYTIDM